MPPTDSLTRLLADSRAGDREAAEKIIPAAYSELRRLAAGFLNRQRLGHTLQPTALVHEAYIKLLGAEQPDWQSRAHFFGIASRLMRQILVDHARRNNAGKRGGGAAKLQLNEELAYSDSQASELMELDEALAGLAAFDERKAQVIEMRFFGGMSGEEIAEALGTSLSTVTRDLRLAQAWLAARLGEGRQPHDSR